MGNTNSQTIRNILSVIAGVLIASAIFLLGGLILLLFIASKVKGHGEESDLGNITLTSIIILSICCFFGGFVTGRISSKSDLSYGAITGLVLIVLFAFMSNLIFDKESVISYIIIISVTLTGAFFAVRMKKK
jgi:hypothetical protein